MKNAISTKDMPREEWLKHRWRIGSSDVSAVIGVNMWKSPLDVYNEKVALLNGQVLPDFDTEEMMWGRMIEDIVAKRFAARTGFKVKRDNKIRIHSNLEFMACNLDRLYHDPKRGWGILEVKTAGDFAASNWQSEIPLPYHCQTQFQCSVTGITWGSIALQVSNRELKIFPFEMDTDFAEKQEQAIVSFWRNNVEKRVPPEYTQLDLDVIYAQPGTAIAVTPEILPIFNDAKSLYIDYKAKEKQYKQLKDRLCLFMKEADILTMDGATLATWKQSKAFRQFNTKLFQKQQPEMYEKFSEETPGTRKFIFHGIKEDKNSD